MTFNNIFLKISQICIALIFCFTIIFSIAMKNEDVPIFENYSRKIYLDTEKCYTCANHNTKAFANDWM